MKNILLLSDFSANSINAIHYAMHFFKNQKCKFHLMNVHKMGSFTSDDLMRFPGESIYQSITREPKGKLYVLKAELENTYKNFDYQFEIHIDFDVFIDAINQAVVSRNIDFVVMGTNGVTGAKEILLGSNTINVIRKVDCKILAIPEGYRFTPIKELLLSVGPRDVIDGNQFTDLLEFMETYQLHLNVLRLMPNKENLDIVKQDRSSLSILNCKYNVVNMVPIDYAVLGYLQTNTVDFMALFVRHEGFLEHLFSKGNNKINISKLPKPILVLHN
ncbi:universal stress protein [Algibacter lectus]|uniref:Nucleotide-binding universal stress UspA family protein n=1 Tax=Algibacter lectus TaxID=221126 RepID=A0A4R8MCT8_9FLAO|nr:universal stress protein [Algibacter lectus]MWW24096.1 universal stress protein [Algibacter lectus]TDY62112.1 nucleotide-binding universal stress UspA family protein [Algibacter lectus]